MSSQTVLISGFIQIMTIASSSIGALIACFTLALMKLVVAIATATPSALNVKVVATLGVANLSFLKLKRISDEFNYLYGSVKFRCN